MKQTILMPAVGIMLKVVFLLMAFTTRDVNSSILYASFAIVVGTIMYTNQILTQNNSRHEQKRKFITD